MYNRQSTMYAASSTLPAWFELVFAEIPHLPSSFPQDFAKVQLLMR
jgi:hypothetical protein